MAGNWNSGRFRDKPFKEAIQIELAAIGKDGKALRALARKLYAMAMEGDIQAIREIGDRLDGKPVQQSDITVSETRTVIRAPAPEASTDAWTNSLKAQMAPLLTSSGNPSEDHKPN